MTFKPFKGHVNHCITFVIECLGVGPLRDTGLVPKDHQQEMA